MLKKGIYVLSKKAMVSTRWRKLENLQQPIKQRPARGLNTKDRRSGKAKWSMTHIDEIPSLQSSSKSSRLFTSVSSFLGCCLLGGSRMQQARGRTEGCFCYWIHFVCCTKPPNAYRAAGCLVLPSLDRLIA